jgi:hypothetical protein
MSAPAPARGYAGFIAHAYYTCALVSPPMSPPNPIAITLLASLVRLLLPWSQGPLTVCQACHTSCIKQMPHITLYLFAFFHFCHDLPIGSHMCPSFPILFWGLAANAGINFGPGHWLLFSTSPISRSIAVRKADPSRGLHSSPPPSTHYEFLLYFTAKNASDT